MATTTVGLPRRSRIATVGLAFHDAGVAVVRELRYAMATPSGRIGLPLVLLHLVVALVGPLLAPFPATEFHLVDRFSGPSATYWLGTDEFGRDVFSRVMSGATSIIGVSMAGTALGILLGATVGLTSGYLGGKLDEIVMRVMDGLLSFPSLLLALLVLTTLGPSRINIVLTIGVVFTPSVARVVRSATLAVKTMEFVQSARLRGEPAYYIVFREILPSTMPVLTVEASVRLSYAILLASSLGFLGLGVQPPSSDWGLMISEGRAHIAIAPMIVLAPAVAVSSLVIGVNLLAEGLREARELPKGDHVP
ncbi:MAG: ABC transporter permease [Actinomycetota bacterium]|nr:ABC transporter permease [Chloroflexota bacterium]MDA2984225.1 ABC transporter permease [Actinomycetota bacterium]